MSSSTNQTVRAWTYTNGYPSTLKLSTTSVPTKTNVSPNHILVRIAACALNPVDIQMMNMPVWSLPLVGNLNEKTTVMDFAGTVVASGNEEKFKAGDEVFGMALNSYKPGGGALSEMGVFDLSSVPVVKKPKGWSWEKSAGVSLVWLTAKACIDAVAPWVEKTKSKRVAILGGSSSTGIYSTLLAKRRGWKVVATSSGKNKEFVLSTLKADTHVDYTKENVREAVGKFEPDAVIDCVGGTECIALPTSRRYITIVGDKTGRTLMGGPYTYIDVTHPIVMATQWARWARGKVGLGESYDVIMLEAKNEWLEEAKETLTEDNIFVDSVFAFEDAKHAFERLNTGRAKGKVIIKVSSKL